MRHLHSRRWILLPVFALITAAEWLRLHHAGVATTTEVRRLFLGIMIAIGIGLVIKLVYSRDWPLQETAHLALLLGLAGLVWILRRSRGGQMTPEWGRDIVQALLDVGAAAFPVGMILWVIFHRHDVKEDTATLRE